MVDSCFDTASCEKWSFSVWVSISDLRSDIVVGEQEQEDLRVVRDTSTHDLCRLVDIYVDRGRERRRSKGQYHVSADVPRPDDVLEAR